MPRAETKKVPLFDRVFKPEHIVLENGNSVDRPRSRMPLILICLIAVIIISLKMTGFDFNVIIRRAKELTVILGQIFRPNFGYFPNIVKPLIETVKMSIIGTIAGCAIGLPLSIFASSNINHNKPTMLVIRFILSVMRSVPTLIYASVLALVFGLGTFAGTLAITVFTVGIVAKMLYESIETIDMKPYEAMISFGASTLQAFWTACMPQILPTYIDDCLYCFELNIRASSILGYVGAGGLGVLIRERTGLRAYNDLGMVLLILFTVVLVIDLVNDHIRSKIM